MPSKAKKSTKAPSSSSSPRTPATLRTSKLKHDASPISISVRNESIDREFLSLAASEHASLIPNADSAFYGAVTGSNSDRERAVVYLSGSAMNNFSLRQGSLVSVWLVPVENQLEGDKIFAIATIRQSSKVLKDGVELSWGLSCTMGFPNIGRSIFISPLSTNFHIISPKTLNLTLISPKSEDQNEILLEDEKSKTLAQIIASRWLYGRHLLKGNIVGVPILGNNYMFKVEYDDNDFSSGLICALLIDGGTKVEIGCDNGLLDNEPDKGDDVSDCDWPMLGGLSKEFEDLMETIYFTLAIESPIRNKGVLLYGPPGTGKTSLACLCAKKIGASLFTINGPEIISQYYGESEQKLNDIFDAAKKAAPSVVFIDEVDAIAPAREEGADVDAISNRITSALLKSMNGIGRDDRVILIAATNLPDSLDPALRRPGRLCVEIEIGVPSPEQRLDILNTLMSKMNHSLSDPEIHSLASKTHGFVGADLAALCNEAGLNMFRRHIASKEERSFNVDFLSEYLSKLELAEVSEIMKGDEEEEEEEEEEEDLVVRFEDFEKAKLKIRPSAMREVAIEVPKVRWSDVGGQSKTKTRLIESVLLPQTHPSILSFIGYSPSRGLLLTGPPGCSKTLLARAVASESELNFIAVKGPELFSKWVGESEKAVRRVFNKARANAPSVVFFDEIDGLAGYRGDEGEGGGVSVGDRVLTQMLQEMDALGDGKRGGVTVIAATNRPDKIDPALLRPGRFDVVEVQPPNESDREDIFKIHTKNMPCAPDVKLKELAILTDGYTGADIKLVCREAALAALKEGEEEDIEVMEVSMRHFERAIGTVRPSDLKFYENLAKQYRRIVD